MNRCDACQNEQPAPLYRLSVGVVGVRQLDLSICAGCVASFAATTGVSISWGGTEKDFPPVAVGGVA